jgi:hypothetical protein
MADTVKKKYRTRFPMDEFVSSDGSFPTITREGVELTAEQLKSARTAAQLSDIRIIEVVIDPKTGAESETVLSLNPERS